MISTANAVRLFTTGWREVLGLLEEMMLLLLLMLMVISHLCEDVLMQDWVAKRESEIHCEIAVDWDHVGVVDPAAEHSSSTIVFVYIFVIVHGTRRRGNNNYEFLLFALFFMLLCFHFFFFNFSFHLHSCNRKSEYFFGSFVTKCELTWKYFDVILSVCWLANRFLISFGCQERSGELHPVDFDDNNGDDLWKKKFLLL